MTTATDTFKKLSTPIARRRTALTARAARHGEAMIAPYLLDEDDSRLPAVVAVRLASTQPANASRG